MAMSLDAICREADAQTDDVEAQMAAAGACDNGGEERRAVVYYDRAARLGVPPGRRREFLVGYGSTLKNVGRVDESLAVLRALGREYPDDRAIASFVALSLHAAGRPDEAIAALLDVALSFSDVAPELTRYRRALTYYRDALLRPATLAFAPGGQPNEVALPAGAAAGA
jgi:tetratricopeptide (TPR) repeat protein